jgi:hypothetical protein
VQAAHPVPDAAGLRATQRIQELVSGLTADDLVIALISGGGSSLLVAPGDGLTLHDKQAVNTALLKSGATISEMNCVRRHLSAVKGGRLAAACYPAAVLTLLISDVPGDNPIDIASGPTVADPTTCADALAIIDRYRIELPPAVRALLLQWRRRERQARRCQAGARRDPHDHRAPDGAGGCRESGAQRRPHALHPGRQPRRRGARSGQGAGRHRAPDRCAWPAFPGAMRAACPAARAR